ncbi:MAG: hypothetical protein EP326_04735 [Deltaproteobacteria bacterium]|nr:MAG: hypothetical protein EP326_04735 [Deltaproteobacteria bacterium]TNF24591.1 MAG: hypothetical protein EP319_18075 [Deltaproteobacteria bacterium]
MSVTNELKTRLSNFAIYAMIGVVLIYMGSRGVSYYETSQGIDTAQERINALGKIQGELGTIKTKKDLIDKVGQQTFTLTDEKLFNRAGIEDQTHIQAILELEARKRRPKTKESEINRTITSIKTLNNNIAFDLRQKRYASRNEFESIRKGFEKTMWKGASETTNWRESLGIFKQFTERVKNTKMDEDFKGKVLFRLGRIMDKHQEALSYLGNVATAAKAEVTAMRRIEELKEVVPEYIIEANNAKNKAYRNFYSTILGDFVKLSLAGIVLLALVVLRLKKTSETQIKGLKTKNRRRNKEVRAANEQLGLLERQSFVATAILDEDENIVWASDSFKQTLGFDKNGYLPNWKKVFERDVFDHSDATGIKGSVKLRNDLQGDYILRSKMERVDGTERRIIQIWPVEEYYQELAGENPYINIPREGIKETYTELGNLVEDLLVKMSVFFQNMRVNVDLGTRLPTLTTANEEAMTLGLANILKGLVFYLSHTKQGNGINLTFTKANGRVNFKIEATDARIDLSEIDKELNFKNKNYHSLGYYLAECERVLEAYGANVGIRNFISSDRETSVAVIEVGLQEKIEVKAQREFKNIRFDKTLYVTDVKGVN